MKITNVTLERLRLPLDPAFHAAWDRSPRRAFDATVVVIDTDEGIRGIGSGDTMDGFEPYLDYFVGEDPLRIQRHVEVLETINFHAGHYWPFEAALWDVIGQALEQPVSVLFGGSTDRIPAYASLGEIKSRGDRVDSVLALRSMGFRAVKLRVDQFQITEGIEVVAAVREAVGTTMEIMVDFNQAWRMPGDIVPSLDVRAIARISHALADLDVFWIEEPLPAGDVRGLAALRNQTALRVAGGEMCRSVPEVLAYFNADALDVYQPDVVLAVGMLRARLVAQLCQAQHRWFTPHTWTNGLGLLANLHVAAGVGGGPFFEFPFDPPGWTIERRDFFLREPVTIDSEGNVVVPNRPGLGAELDEDAVSRWRVEA